MVGEPEPTTQELRALQRDRSTAEREAEQAATGDAEARAHRRRAEKAAYLEERLAEQERALEGDEG